MSNYNNNDNWGGNMSNYYNNPKNSYDIDNRYYNDDVVSIGTWILIMIATLIPIISIIVTLVLAFGQSNENLKNYGKAALIIWGIGLLLVFMFGGCSRL